MTIDFWTLGIQAVNVLILIFLLQRFFWRPVAGMIAKRQADANAIMDNIKARRDEADSALAAIQATRAGFAAEREALLAKAAQDAAELKATALAEARTEAEGLRASALATIARDDAAAEKVRTEQAVALAVSIAARLAARLDGPCVQTAFLDWLITEIVAMPAPDLRVVSQAKDTELTLVSASPVDPEMQSSIAARLTKAFDASPSIRFSVDPELIAGFELHSAYFILRNSWQADLARIQKELAHGA
jgi:F-type H+-transporting ATPase subunit b